MPILQLAGCIVFAGALLLFIPPVGTVILFGIILYALWGIRSDNNRITEDLRLIKEKLGIMESDPSRDFNLTDDEIEDILEADTGAEKETYVRSPLDEEIEQELEEEWKKNQTGDKK